MINVKCTRCGVVNLLSNETCKACGLELSASSTQNDSHETPRPQYAEFSGSRPFGIASIKPGVNISEVLGSSITLFSRNFWLITKLVLIIVTPFEVFKALSVTDLAGNWQLAVGTLGLQIFCNILITPALIYALMRIMQTGVAPGVNESYRWGLTRLGKVSLSALMSWILAVLGLALCIIPGIFLLLAFELVYPIAVLEEGSPIAALKRSYKMTDGFRGNIFGATLLMSILLALAGAPGSILVTQLNSAELWPLHVLVAIIADILSQATTILSLVIYLSILRTLAARQSVIE